MIDETKIDVISDYNRNSCTFQFIKNNKGNRSTKTRLNSRNLGQGSFNIYRYRSLDERSRTRLLKVLKKKNYFKIYVKEKGQLSFSFPTY